MEELKSTAGHTSLDWIIQRADWRDYLQLNSLERTCFQAEDIWPFWDVIGILTLPGYVRWKAVLDGQMIGFVGGERNTARRVGWVTTIAILPEYRRLGIAALLLTKCEDDLAMPIIRLTVRASNQAAICLYENAGYQVFDHWKRYYAGGEDALVFEKKR